MAEEQAVTVDTFPVMSEAAKRDLDATAWAIALATPGLFAGLSQVDKLFKASRVPWAFGYVFGTMQILLLVSIYLGLRNYRRLHSILGMLNSMQSNRLIREGWQAWLVAEWKKETPDFTKINEYDQKIRSFFDAMPEHFEVLSTLHAPGPHVFLQQSSLLQYAYLLFVLILLTSDFARLL